MFKSLFVTFPLLLSHSPRPFPVVDLCIPVAVGGGGGASGGNVYKLSRCVYFSEPMNFMLIIVSGLVNLDMLNFGSGNRGDGGSASSGSALGGAGGCHSGSGSGGPVLPSLVMCVVLIIFPGTGGWANGGNVYSTENGGLVNLDMLNVDSGNAGNGAQPTSGSAIGGSGGRVLGVIHSSHDLGPSRFRQYDDQR